MINICPVGRSCSRAERNDFIAFDKVRKVSHRISHIFVDKKCYLSLYEPRHVISINVAF